MKIRTRYIFPSKSVDGMDYRGTSRKKQKLSFFELEGSLKFPATTDNKCWLMKTAIIKKEKGRKREIEN